MRDYPHAPEACLINFYGAAAKMGLHQDRDEADFAAPVVSLSLGDSCLFRVGGAKRGDPTRSFRLNSGDVLVLGGGARLAFHGVDRIYPGTSTLLAEGGRINLTHAAGDAPQYRRLQGRGSADERVHPNSAMPSAIRIHSIAAVLALTVLAIPGARRRSRFPDRLAYRAGPARRHGAGQNVSRIRAIRSKNVAIVITTLPADAFDALDKSAVPDVLRKQGMTVDKREPFQLKAGKGFLVTGTEMGDKKRYRKWILVAAAGRLDGARHAFRRRNRSQPIRIKSLRDALATLAVRADVPDAERLSLLPFTVGDLAGFRIERCVAGPRRDADRRSAADQRRRTSFRIPAQCTFADRRVAGRTRGAQ